MLSSTGIGARALALTLAWWLGWPSSALAIERADDGLIDIGTPLQVRNLAPVAQLYGLPWALGPVLPAGAHKLALLVEHANNFTARVTPDTTVEFDGETTVSSLIWQYSVGERFEWGLTVPFVHHGGGFTDGLIEDFHDLFGFSDHERDEVPRNRLSYRVAYRGETLASVTDSTSDLGDVRGWLGYRLYHGVDRSAALRLMVKAPTGDAADLSGSGATDGSLAVELTDFRTLSGLGIAITLMTGLSVLGDGDLLQEAQRDVALVGHLGLHYPVHRRVTVRAQLDGHSDVFDSPVEQLGGAALQGTLGASVALSRQAWVDLGLAEDLSGAGAPDVTFLLTFGARL